MMKQIRTTTLTRARFLAIAVISPFLIAACQSDPPRQQPPPRPKPTAPAVSLALFQPLWDAEAKQLATFPVPPAAVETLRHPSGGTQTTDQTAQATLIVFYATNPTMSFDDVLTYYDRELPQAGWTVSRATAPTGTVLRFARGDFSGMVSRDNVEFAAQTKPHEGSFAVVMSHAPVPWTPTGGNG